MSEDAPGRVMSDCYRAALKKAEKMLESDENAQVTANDIWDWAARDFMKSIAKAEGV